MISLKLVTPKQKKEIYTWMIKDTYRKLDKYYYFIIFCSNKAVMKSTDIYEHSAHACQEASNITRRLNR